MQKINDGYILLARKLTDSDIMHKPHLYFKLWSWMLIQAKFKSGMDVCPRGYFKTSINAMREMATVMIGNRKEVPSIKEIRTAYGYLVDQNMISISKGKNGMIIKIINFGYYQSPSNYEKLSTPINGNKYHNVVLPKVTPKGTDKNYEEYCEHELT